MINQGVMDRFCMCYSSLRPLGMCLGQRPTGQQAPVSLALCLEVTVLDQHCQIEKVTYALVTDHEGDLFVCGSQTVQEVGS